MLFYSNWVIKLLPFSRQWHYYLIRGKPRSNIQNKSGQVSNGKIWRTWIWKISVKQDTMRLLPRIWDWHWFFLKI